MKIRAYIRLQDCRTNNRRAFVPRSQAEHGIAKGRIHYYAVEGGSWNKIRKTLKVFDVVGHTNCRADTVCGWTQDIGTAREGLWKLVPKEVPAAVLWDLVKSRASAPELSSFGVGAIEIVRCEQCDSKKLTAQNNGFLICDACGHEQKES
jgi:hypothetical protein